MNDDSSGAISKTDPKTDWRRLRSMTDEEIHAAIIDDPDAKPTDEAFWDDAHVTMPRPKKTVTIRSMDSAFLDLPDASGKGNYSFDAATEKKQRYNLAEAIEGPKLKDADGKVFFELVLGNTMEGFFADPIYGGNRDMVGWKLVGFPGARYDFRDHVAKHNQPYPLPPVSILGRGDWSVPE